MHFLAEQEHTNTEVAQTCTPALQQRKRRQTMAAKQTAKLHCNHAGAMIVKARYLEVQDGR
jgi:hypothetical protein